MQEVFVNFLKKYLTKFQNCAMISSVNKIYMKEGNFYAGMVGKFNADFKNIILYRCTVNADIALADASCNDGRSS